MHLPLPCTFPLHRSRAPVIQTIAALTWPTVQARGTRFPPLRPGLLMLTTTTSIELISHDQPSVEVLLSSFPGLQFVNANDATLLGSSLGDIASINETLEAKANQLKLIGERLCYLHSHDVITLLRHFFAIPKLLHILRTSPAFLSPTLLPFDQLLMSIVSQITHIHFHIDDPTWAQATLPVGSGGLGLRSATHLAPSAFLASAVRASSLIEQLLPPHLQKTTYIEQDLALRSWRECLPSDSLQPESPTSHLQKAWDKPRVQSRWDSLFSNCVDPQARARLMAAQTKESGEWLNALPVSSLGLHISDDSLHIAICLRLGTPLCLPHKCTLCGMDVDRLVTHGLSCRHSQGRIPRHNAINDIIHRSLSASKIPSRLEPLYLHRSDGIRPEGMTMTP